MFGRLQYAVHKSRPRSPDTLRVRTRTRNLLVLVYRIDSFYDHGLLCFVSFKGTNTFCGPSVSQAGLLTTTPLTPARLSKPRSLTPYGINTYFALKILQQAVSRKARVIYRKVKRRRSTALAPLHTTSLFWVVLFSPTMASLKTWQYGVLVVSCVGSMLAGASAVHRIFPPDLVSTGSTEYSTQQMDITNSTYNRATLLSNFEELVFYLRQLVTASIIK